MEYSISSPPLTFIDSFEYCDKWREWRRPWAEANRASTSINEQTIYSYKEEGASIYGTWDSLLFNGLLFYSGEDWAGDAILRSMDHEGGIWRSPLSINNDDYRNGINRLSMDHALGACLYIVSLKNRGRLDEARAYATKWSEWIEKYKSGTVGFDFCICKWNSIGGTDWDACQIDTPFGGRANVIRDVLDYVDAPIPEKGVWPFKTKLGEGSDENRYFAEISLLCDTDPGFHCHLKMVASLLYQAMGNNSYIFPIHPSFSRNPFFHWVSGRRKRTALIADLLKSHMDSLDIKTSAKKQWAWQRTDQGQAVRDSNGWDCIMMANILTCDLATPYNDCGTLET